METWRGIFEPREQKHPKKSLSEVLSNLARLFRVLVQGFNAGGTADFILIISVPGYFKYPGTFLRDIPAVPQLK